MAYGWSRKRRRDRIFERFSEIYQTLEREDRPLRQRLSAEDWSYLKERCDSFQEIGRGMSLSEDQRVLVEKFKALSGSTERRTKGSAARARILGFVAWADDVEDSVQSVGDS